MRKLILKTVLAGLAVSGLAAFSSEAQAQFRGRSGGSGFGISFGTGGGGYRGGYGGFGGGYGGGYRSGFGGGYGGYGNNFGYGRGYNSGFGYNSGYRSGVYSSPLIYSSPQVYAQPSIVYPETSSSYQSFYPPVSTTTTENTASITVNAPANAELWWNGSFVTPGVRRFATAPLNADGSSQLFQARWIDSNGQTVTRSRQVKVMPNSQTTVDFMQTQASD